MMTATSRPKLITGRRWCDKQVRALLDWLSDITGKFVLSPPLQYAYAGKLYCPVISTDGRIS